jgi:hypothetical protein
VTDAFFMSLTQEQGQDQLSSLVLPQPWSSSDEFAG